MGAMENDMDEPEVDWAEIERRLLSNSALMLSIEQARAHPEERVRRSRPQRRF